MRSGFRSGIAAALVAVIVAVLFRRLSGEPSLLERLMEGFTALLPPPVFSFLLGLFEFYAKPLLGISLVGGFLLAGGVLGALFGKLAQERRWPLARASRLWRGLLLGLPPGLLMMPLPFLVQTNLREPSSVLLAVSTVLLPWLTYGVTTAWIYRGQRQRSLVAPEPAAVVPQPSRRRLVKGIAVGTLALLTGGGLWRLLSLGARTDQPQARESSSPSSLTQESGSPTAHLVPEVTPIKDFYVVSKNLFDPTVDGARWRLEVGGAVEHPYQLTYEALRELPSQQEYVTLECISNEVGGDLMSNALWQGIPLRDLLERAGLKAQAQKVAFYAADGYSDSISLTKALDPAVLVAYRMNGEPLPPNHGFPARLIVPGIYGMKHIKWVTKIEAVDYDFQGFWQQRGWSDDAIMKTTSRIDTPRDGTTPAQDPWLIGGVAFTGDRGVAKVEYSLDTGQTWREATVKEALSPYTWVLWFQEERPLSPGLHRLRVRALDKTGQLQEEAPTDPFPDGAAGYHGRSIRMPES